MLRETVLFALLINSLAFSVPFGGRATTATRRATSSTALFARRTKSELAYANDLDLTLDISSSTPGIAVAAEYVAETNLPTDIGSFKLRAYRIPGGVVGQEPCVMYYRDKPPFRQDGELAQNVPVRIHDQCLTSEVFGSQR